MAQDGFDPARLRRAAGVAHDYDALMGLASVGYGCGFLVAALSGQVPLGIFLGVMIGTACTAWYRHRFGMTLQRGHRALRATVLFALGLLIPLAAVMLEARLHPPLSLMLLAMAVLLGGVWVVSLRRVGLTAAHWGGCAVMVLAALAPLAGIGGGGPFSSYVLTVVGLVLVVVGLVDHVRLVRALPAAPAGDSARAR